MQTYQINVSNARDMVQEIRHELFGFPEVLDVFVAGRPDWLVVVSRGRPRPGEWLRALRAVGYDVPVGRRATQAVEADQQGAAAPAGSPAPGITARPPSRARPRAQQRHAGVLGASRGGTTHSVPPWADRESDRRRAEAEAR